MISVRREVRKNAVRERGEEFMLIGLSIRHPLPNPGFGIQVCKEKRPFFSPGTSFSGTPSRVEADSIPARKVKEDIVFRVIGSSRKEMCILKTSNDPVYILFLFYPAPIL